jgi:hypothetical protein
MRKPNLNFLVDTVAFAAFVLIAATGVLIRYVLPAGHGHFSTLWGLNRHEWGDIHFWIAVVFVSALALHFVLHWRWIVAAIKGRSRNGSGVRVALAMVGVLVLAGLVAAPFFGRVERSGRSPHKLRSGMHPASPAHQIERSGKSPHGSHSGEHPASPAHQIDGSMTLDELEQRTGVPTEVVLRELGLPLDLPTDERLGRLRREHAFEMQDVRDIVRKHVEQR